MRVVGVVATLAACMGRVAAIAVCALILFDQSAQAQTTPDSITIPLSQREGILFPNNITVTAGGGPPSPVTFDVGSIGLYMLQSAVGPNVTPTGSTFMYGYEDGDQISGPIVLTTVTFPEASTPVETSQLAMGIITSQSCAPDKPDCPGVGQGAGSGRVGVFGARYYNTDVNGIFNPLAFLPGNLNSGYIVAATGPTPGLIVGLTPYNTAPFTFTNLQAKSTSGQGGVPYAWELKSIDVYFSVNGGPSSHAVTSFDTGEGSAQFYASVDPSLINANGYLIPNQSVTISIPGILTQTVTTGDTAWLDLNKIVTPAGIGNPLGYNSGAQFYYYYAVAYDYLTGRAGFSPLTTWIIGTYQAKHDSDLGDPGAIAIDGTLALADGFSSSRAMFIGGDSTIKTLGNATLAGTLSGLAPLKIAGPGTLTLSGVSINSGPVLVDGATVLVDGILPPVVVLADGTIGGNGTIGALVAGGGVISPGHSIGTLTVAGDAVLGPGAVYQAEVDPHGRSDQIVVGGTLNLSGAILRVLAQNGGYASSTRYVVIDKTSGGPATGTFAEVTTNSIFLAPTVDYDGGAGGNDVVLTLTRVPFSSVADTRNQKAVATALDEGVFGPLAEAIFFQTEQGARQAFDALSGEVHATTAGVLADDSRYVRDAILGRMIQADYSGSGTQVAALGADNAVTVASLDDQAMGLGPRDAYAPPAAPDLAFWTRGFGAWANFDGNVNTASASRQLGGFVSGMDAGVGGGWRLGAATGFSQSSIKVDARHSSADVDTVYLAAYAGGSLGPVALRSGGAWGWHDIDTSRAVVFPGFSEKEQASYSGDTGQVFGEAAYPMLMGPAGIEPFAGLAFVHVSTDSFHERGGVAALKGASEEQDVGYSTLGFRVANTMHLQDMVITPHASIAWQHAFDNLTPDASLAFLSMGIGFDVTGVPLAQNSALIDVGLDLNLNPTITIGVSYAGQFANDLQDNAVKGRLTWLF